MKRLKQLLLSFILIGIGCSGWAQLPQLPDTVLRTLKASHPRIIVHSLQDFEDIKMLGKTDSFVMLSIRNCIKNADIILQEPVVTYSFLDAFRMNTRKVNSHCYGLSMAYRLTGNKKYAERLWQDLEAISRFPDWNPRHFLDCGLMTQPVAIAYDWLYDVWTPEQRRVIKQQIISKGLLESLVYYDKLVNKNQFDWSVIEHNWNLVCNGNMAVGALAIADDEPQLAERILKEALTRFPKSLRHFGPDGAWDEGPGYWSFAMRNSLPLLTSLVSALGTDFGISDIAGFSKAGQFFVALGGAKAVSFNYADANPVITRAPELFWLANRFGQPTLTEVQKSYSAAQLQKDTFQQSPLELIWYKPANSVRKNNFPLDYYFRNAEVAALRSGWADKDWFVAFKAGNNDVNHGHLDIGSYVLDYNGVRWIMDLGFENYNVPGYFGEANVGKGGIRWTYYRTRAEGHNTLVINPGLTEDQDIDARTKVERFSTQESKPFGIMDISDAYKGKVSSAKRGIAMLNRNRILVQDEIVATSNIDLYWFSHTQAAITLSADKRSAFLEQDGKTLIARLLLPPGAVFEIRDARPLPTSPNPEANNKNTGIRKLAIHITGASNTTIAVEYAAPDDKSKTVIRPLANW